MQEEVIRSVAAGNDTLALLPTGGGKSICYQVPALASEGLCLVISPLVALMKDQVDNLQSKGIRALYIFSGMKPREIDIALDNAAYGHYKFLYVSPERLETELFRQRAHKLNINLIAVDEAHCISQWGYDFRPPYLKIAEIREYFPGVPILALTATATPRVEKDIADKLGFGKKAQVFRQSFERRNIIYSVIGEDNKTGRLLRLLQMIPGTAIIYAGYRRTCKETALYLQHNGISADFYHAGLTHEERNQKQEAWKAGKTRVMVCTNAFGMGIDKADVRLIVHLNMPASLEAYYQETGRAGRDGERAYAVAMVNAHDIDDIKAASTLHLDTSFLKRIYQALGNYLQVPEDSGAGESFDFDIGDFVKRYNFGAADAYKALKELETAGFISLSDSVLIPSRLMIKVDHNSLYQYQVNNPDYEALLKTILRSYGGCFEEYVAINEKNIGKRLGVNTKMVMQQLYNLDKMKVIDYLPLKSSPQLSFLTPRMASHNLSFGLSNLNDRKAAAAEQTKCIIRYVEAGNRCRGKILLQYFGEEKEKNCGHCDFCINELADTHSAAYQEKIMKTIKDQLSSDEMTLKSLVEQNPGFDEKQLIEAVRWMLDQQILRYADGQMLALKK